MNTLHVDLGAGWRGGQNQALLLLEGLRARGHGAELIAVEGAALAERATQQKFVVHPVSKRARRARALLRIRKLLSKNEFDLVHVHDAHSLTAAWFARAHTRTAVIASRRVAFPLQTNQLALQRYRTTRRVLAVSSLVAEQVRAAGIPGEQVTVVPDGVMLPPAPTPEQRRTARAHWGIESNQRLLGCLGALEPNKGHDLLLRALPLLRNRFTNARLLLAGDGPCRDSLETLAEKLGMAGAVQFLGDVGDLTLFFNALDVFLFPSVREGLGSALLLAMAHVVPPVAFAGGAAGEIIENQRNGLLAETTDPEALATSAARLLGDADLAQRLGAAARDTIEQRFTVNHMVENTLRVYHQAFKQESPA